MARIEYLRTELGLSRGELLKLAREQAQDGALVSVSQLRGFQRELLIKALEAILIERFEQNLLTRGAVEV
jgi:hypothetical protein